MDYKFITNCRVCGSANLRKYLDLGRQPLANGLLNSPETPRKYPLQVLFCQECSLSQLSIVIDPKIIYKNYPYHSSVSETFKNHCREMAITIKKMYENSYPEKVGTLKKDIKGRSYVTDSISKPFVVDIASNDGCLLEEFKAQNYYVMGVEPSKNLAQISNKKGISTVNGFWEKESAKGVPSCDVITATNVFAHVDDIKSFLELAKSKLRLYTKGIMVVEVPYLLNLIEQIQFDTIYHEHLSYFLVRPLRIIFKRIGIPIFKVEQYPIHGGSIRIYASPYERKEHQSVKEMEEKERAAGLYQFKTYTRYAKKVRDIRDHMVSLLKDLKSQGKKIAAYGASAKGISLMNYCGITNTDISYIADDTKAKQGKYAPGCNIPIVSKDHFDSNHPDFIALLPWNFADELMAKTKKFKLKGGKYIIPIPQVRLA